MISAVGKLFLKLLGGTRNERLVRARMRLVREKINPAGRQLEDEYAELARQAARGEGAEPEEYVRQVQALQLAPLSAREWLTGKSRDLRRRRQEGQALESLLPEAFALIRLASWLARDHRQFDVQMGAGQVLFSGTIAEEATGEGKTIACYPAIYLTCLDGKRVHIVTTNDYLVKRDRDFAWPVFHLVGLKVGAIQQPMEASQRQEEYACDVVYGSNTEFGFDYLRDNMKYSVAEQAQGPLQYAIVDEVDNILIDEARTPLIISGPAYGNVERYRKADVVARDILQRHRPHEQASRRIDALKRQVKALGGEISKAQGGEKEGLAKRLQRAEEELAQAEDAQKGLTKYFEVELDKKSVHLTHEGIGAAQESAGVGSFYVGANMEWPHLMEQALRAHVVYERDKDYVVRGSEVVIVDEFTGRLMEGREWSDGLHQAVDAKENVTIKEENQTIATITFQNLFRLYGKLAGMTGTAMTEAEEFLKIYKLDVISVPTHRPVNRVDYDDRIYGTVEEKYDALVEEIHACSRKGRPVLVGTTSIEKSEKLSAMLTQRYGVEHEVLNARPENAGREADIVALAGHQHRLKAGSKEMVGNVTIATNMAGRGTDIKLGAGVVWHNCKVPARQKLEELGVAYEDLFPSGATKCCLYCPQYDATTRCAHCYKPKLDGDFPDRGRADCRQDTPCGLHIVGTERHEARRIDNQLRGRSGRQGDPGSSRFFLSLRDELMVIFAGEWTLKVLKWLGLQHGQAIEDKRISRGIARAQKKVEQRNFEIRKNLLEYDEVMDRQRHIFYARRQQILEGRQIEATVREMIQDSVEQAVANYLAPDYARRCLAEWARQNLELVVTPDRIKGESVEDLPFVEADLRDLAKEEAAATITITIGEYAAPDSDPEDWDLRGLSSWAMSRFSVGIAQNQLRKLSPEEMERALTQAAWEHIDSVDMSPLGRFLEAGLASRALAEWARSKYGVELVPGELPPDEPASAGHTILQVVDAAYLRRQIEYPVQYALDVTIARTGPENVYGLGALCEWANRKYLAGWTPEKLAGRSIEQLQDELTALAEPYFTGGRLQTEVDEFLRSLPEGDQAARQQAICDWAARRFDLNLAVGQLGDGDVRERLVSGGRAFLRRELTELERFVLLQIYDVSWKDHLLAMDHLKSGVGLRSFAEQDPKIAYKKEGFRLFEEMLASAREKVTDVIFKARMSGQADAVNVYRISQMVHEQLSGYDALAQEMQAQQAAGAPQKVQQIVRQTPRVGRNHPCPCGSGKKYKRCHGREK